MSFPQDSRGIPVYSRIPSGTTTYFVNEKIVGPGSPPSVPKDMLTLLNPSASGKVIRLLYLTVQCVLNSGTNVVMEYELARISAHTGGTTVTPSKRDSSDSASSAESKSGPTGVTGYARIMTFAFQTNTAQAPNTYTWNFSNAPGEKPLVLNAGEGIVLRHLLLNGGDFAITYVWNEE